ncbi:winged helix-turn-helix domain-containing protein [Caulobacter sp. BE254]|uniref:winged helix-turn-helix domain-containing protein n=1 Tax=Caulobacter sp. BE254 TaxID=2817720 RepID=UPI0038579D53
MCSVMEQGPLTDSGRAETRPCATGRDWALPGGTAPRYRQLYALIRQRLSEGKLRPGARLPEERHLARLCGVSRTTVRGALALLDAEGLVRRRTRVGTVICGG